MRCTISYDKVTHTHTHTHTNLSKHRGVLNPSLLPLSCPSPAPDLFLLPSLLPVLSPRPPSLLSPRPPRRWAGGGGHGVVILGHGGLFWGSLGWVVVFLAPGIDQVCTVRDFYQISLNSDDFWKTTSVTKKLWCRIINFWAISLTIEPWSFLNISAYPELKEDHFGAKKSLKS